MRVIIFIATVILFSGCAKKKNTDIFIRPINPSIKQVQINVKPTDNDIYFSNELWDHITTNFQSASIELFRISNVSYPISLNDSSYTFAMITGGNRENLVKYLPKNLSIAESSNYTEETTMMIPGADSNFTADTLKKKWEKATPEIEAEYLKFYALITDKASDHIIIMRKSYLRHLLEIMKTF